MRGMKTGGRKKGTPNKTTAELKQIIMDVFSGMGGETAMLAWAQENPSDFFTKVLPKILPRDMALEVTHTLVDDLTMMLDRAKKNAEASRKTLN